MKYKLFVTDMDGTLLNSNGKVSKENKEALQYLHDNDVHVAIATGRIYTTAKLYAKYVGLVTPIICSNGAIVKNLETDELIYGDPISEEDCLSVIDIFKSEDTNFYFFDEETIYGENFESNLLKISEWRKTMNEEDHIKIKEIHDSKEIVTSGKKIYKFGFKLDDPIKMNELYMKLKNNTNLEVYKSRHDIADIMNKGVSKGKAVERLAKSLGVSRDEVIAIGDNENDISMIKYAGLGIAMGNADEKVKGNADFITETNDSNGVAKAIERFLMNK